MESPDDAYALVTTIVRIEAGLRLVAHHPDKYGPNGHHDRIAKLLTLLQAEVTSWLEGPPGDQRHQQRRQQPDRRVEARRTGTERREESVEPPASESVA
jgi:hypothetical protein